MKHRAAGEAEKPESAGYDALLAALRGYPLDEETAEEEGLSQESDPEPEGFWFHVGISSANR